MVRCSFTFSNFENGHWLDGDGRVCALWMVISTVLCLCRGSNREFNHKSKDNGHGLGFRNCKPFIRSLLFSLVLRFDNLDPNIYSAPFHPNFCPCPQLARIWPFLLVATRLHHIYICPSLLPLITNPATHKRLLIGRAYFDAESVKTDFWI